MSANVTPFSSSAASVYLWATTVPTIAANDGSNAAKASGSGLQVNSDSVFVHTGYAGATNYDGYAGDFIALIGAGPAAARTQVSPALVPNNFRVQVKMNSDKDFFKRAMPQGALCSNGYRAGNELPFPVIYQPNTQFDFEFENIAPTVQQNADGSARPLQIYFALTGYLVVLDELSAWLKTFPPYRAAAGRGPGWISCFTNIQAYQQIIS